ncbi:DUF481 domain-containing protein [Tenacibaculum tangerinum]|uniref:DUF481 domain-containing protein n=1 Tax=Tenacibaculum tangerinum TaxID=3038772 RepID=A0ABY8L4L0_9FLAO|nr:DUF481 domain-containing protein [Tenacibaculum tangerinum]WGH75133.1 DUF481 domain-containing protein [Tenacibaculum tangerinum]
MKLRIFLLLLTLISSLHSVGQEDRLLLKNNDELIGEIKSMNRGVLTMETSYSDSDFKIDWLDVLEIDCKQDYLITLSSGKRFYTKIKSHPNDKGFLFLTENNETFKFPIEEVVEFKSVEASFLSRLSADFSLGFNYTKSNNLTQFITSAKINYSDNKWETTAGLNTVISTQDNADRTERTDGNVGVRMFLQNDWFINANATFLSNNQIDLDLRTNIRAGAGNYVVRSNQMYFGVGAGLAWNNEKYITNIEENKNSLEAYGGLEFNMFDVGDLDIFTRVLAYPSLTEKGRFRTDLELDVKYDLPLDLFIKLGLKYNYDNQPALGFEKDDYILNTTIGWEFN